MQHHSYVPYFDLGLALRYVALHCYHSTRYLAMDLAAGFSLFCFLSVSSPCRCHFALLVHTYVVHTRGKVIVATWRCEDNIQ